MKVFAVLIGLLLSIGAQAERLFSSGPAQVTLVELYTSEGCSSCPPADRWLSAFKKDPRLWSEVVPVAFHVDYWDYLGWPDVFADKQHSYRQRRHEREGNIRVVATPGFVVNGEGWRGWFGRPRPLPDNANSDAGLLNVNVADNDFKADFTPGIKEAQQRGALNLHLAWLGAGLVTEVRAGENAGEALRHDFVLLSSKKYPVPVVSDETSEQGNPAPAAQWQGRLPVIPTQLQAQQLALVAWVTREGSLKPLQSLGGWW